MKSPTTDAVEILKNRYYKDDPKREAALEEVRANEEVARKIYKLRNDAGLTHKQLAKETAFPLRILSRWKRAITRGIIWPRCVGL